MGWTYVTGTEPTAAEWLEQQRRWELFYRAQVAQGRCPYSGAKIVTCHASDLCDCFDFPEVPNE